MPKLSTPSNGGGGASDISEVYTDTGVKTADFTITGADSVICPVDTTSGVVSITLNASPTAGMRALIVDVGDNAGTNPITIVGTIDGATNATITADGAMIEVAYINSNWETLDGNSRFFVRDASTGQISCRAPDKLVVDELVSGDTGTTYTGTVAGASFTNEGANVDQGANDFGNVFTIDGTKFHTDQTNNTTPAPYVASNDNGDSTAYLAFLAANGNNLNRSNWWQMDNGSGIAVAKVKIITAAAGITSDQANYIIVRGSDNGVDFTDVYTNTNSGISGSNQTFEFTFTTQTFRYWRLDFSNSNSAGGSIKTINFFSGSYATTANTFEQRILTAGGSTTFSPSTLAGTDDSDLPINDGEINLEYSTDLGVSWSTSQGLTAFKANSNITATSFWLRLSNVGASRLRSIQISTAATNAKATSTGFEVNFDSVTVGKITNDGFEIRTMTTTSRDAISSPATGLTIFNTTTGYLNTYNGSSWVEVTIPEAAYTSAEETKLAGIATGAEVNVNADWNASSGDAQILNKPTIPTASPDVIGGGNVSTSTSTPDTIAIETGKKLIILSGSTQIIVKASDDTYECSNGSYGKAGTGTLTGSFQDILHWSGAGAYWKMRKNGSNYELVRGGSSAYYSFFWV